MRPGLLTAAVVALGMSVACPLASRAGEPSPSTAAAGSVPEPPAQAPALPLPSASALPAAADSLEAWLTREPDCAAFSDGCQICVRAAGKPRCSTPGIACQPTGWQCRRRETAGPDSPAAPAQKR